MKTGDNILLISGTGRNSGKTTLACELISHFSKIHQVIGLKISPHFHKTSSMQIEIHKCGNCGVYEETDANTSKDSSRMLRAGAVKVLYIQCDDLNLGKIISTLDNIIQPENPVICESGSLGLYYNVGLHVVINGDNYNGDKASANENLKNADLVIQQKELEINFVSEKVAFNKGKWNLH